MIEKAITLANHWHGGQKRKETIGGHSLPYVFHPLEVAKTLYSWGVGEEKIVVAAVLHDLLEDTKCPPEIIEENFGRDILLLVEELTYRGPDKQSYIISFEKKSPEALLIKAADRVCNVEDYRMTNPKYAQKYANKASYLINFFLDREGELISRFSERAFKRALGNLTRIIGDY